LTTPQVCAHHCQDAKVTPLQEFAEVAHDMRSGSRIGQQHPELELAVLEQFDDALSAVPEPENVARAITVIVTDVSQMPFAGGPIQLHARQKMSVVEQFDDIPALVVVPEDVAGAVAIEVPYAGDVPIETCR